MNGDDRVGQPQGHEITTMFTATTYTMLQDIPVKFTSYNLMYMTFLNCPRIYQ